VERSVPLVYRVKGSGSLYSGLLEQQSENDGSGSSPKMKRRRRLLSTRIASSARCLKRQRPANAQETCMQASSRDGQFSLFCLRTTQKASLATRLELEQDKEENMICCIPATSQCGVGFDPAEVNKISTRGGKVKREQYGPSTRMFRVPLGRVIVVPCMSLVTLIWHPRRDLRDGAKSGRELATRG
jgi:hypothetical protein